MKQATYDKLLPHAGKYAHGARGEYKLHDWLAYWLVMLARVR